MKSKILIFLLIGILLIGEASSDEIPCQPIKVMGTVVSSEGAVQGALVEAAINGQVVGYYTSNSIGQYIIFISNTTVMNGSSAEVNLTATKEDKTNSNVITISCNETKEDVDIMLSSQNNEVNELPLTAGDINATPEPTTPEPIPSEPTPTIKPKPSKKGLTIITSPSKAKSDEKIEIQVKYQDRAMANAKVIITLPNGNTLDEKTDDNGTLVIQLQAGDATINAEANGMTASKKITVESSGFPYFWLIIIIILIVLILGYVIFKRMQ